jgi:hypothetical protein
VVSALRISNPTKLNLLYDWCKYALSAVENVGDKNADIQTK